MPTAIKTKSLALLAITLTGAANAGEQFGPVALDPAPADARHWCDAFQTLGGPLYKDANNPYIQEVDFFGRAQWQYAYVDGEDVAGNDFYDSFEEWRRVRIGAQIKFLQYFALKGNIDLVSDPRPRGGSGVDWDYQQFDELKLTTDLGKMIGTGGFDSLKLTAGRIKFNFSHEGRTSSKKIKTPERSAIANKVYASGKGTGFVLDATKGDFSYTAGVFGDEDRESLGGFDNGLTYYASLGFEASDTASYRFDAAYNDSDAGTDADFLGYDWALSLSGEYDYGRMGIMWNAIYGDNGGAGTRGGNFYGLIIMPNYWIIEDTLEAVVRYQYAGADESEGISLNSRYLARAQSRGVADVNGGRGDEHQSIFAGLNYYLCGHNLKLMTGVEFENLQTPAGDVDATTIWLASRMYF